MEEVKLLKLLQGKHTVEGIAKELGIKKTSALNLISKLRKQGYIKTEGGGKQKRIYTISTKKEIKGDKSLYEIINKYSKIKVIPLLKHAAYGAYSIENALIDAVITKNFRIIQASLYLFNHVGNWKKLHHLARKNNIEPEIGALYDTARLCIKTRKMPENIRKSMRKEKRKRIIIRGLKTDDKRIKQINAEWNVEIPFSKRDLEGLK